MRENSILRGVYQFHIRVGPSNTESCPLINYAICVQSNIRYFVSQNLLTGLHCNFKGTLMWCYVQLKINCMCKVKI